MHRARWMQLQNFRTESASLLALAVCASVGCTKAAPEPARGSPDAGGLAVAAPSVAAPDTPSRPGDASVARAGDAGAEDLGWDLDPADPARDYVKRYIRATNRYGDKSDCVLVGKSVPKNGTSEVEVRENPAMKCGTSNAVRDVFSVDVAGDRLTVDDPATRAPLARWPDESKPDAPAEPLQVLTFKEWKSPMASLFQKLLLAPVRIEARGRGTYMVVVLAGWHAPIARDVNEETLRQTGSALCKANEGRSFAITAALDYETWLRFKCPEGGFRWDQRRPRRAPE